MLSSEQIERFQLLYEQRFGKRISQERAYELGTKLITLVRLTHGISPKEQKKRNERRRQNGNHHD
ncbi:MAG: hypothetical protein A2W61_01910 [Deltaproteobacteria bacterium RIFCSPLOWO2_01_44_7]|nr:MAG: hypothetical protein A2712_06410 [Deltaproteobacteria bacterium RIFCSPHIGHO2_01_FULL_43_49]OGQ15986.1 MAG: hypothetical protein A3D22_06260 [Deltaproteobacteria bacterium RIFCSPHIGHO2_02_FULL_44_53]OGQ28943.1 MAG: hypothetical protein A3D98_03845 [Deltaproteobacteria bacterium RIFCSPHIGHO2_12_FULL_44_21]OGQ33186.1 MAG: hypothetical protein A2979_04180 [Deltaproteobacteria bacterium RIFCSPLOWO2_01_FULL_45_74]OGQ42282.1 MAG: hypothetical protein A3I70_06485 [Deltaproteobacteria bacterium 